MQLITFFGLAVSVKGRAFPPIVLTSCNFSHHIDNNHAIFLITRFIYSWAVVRRQETKWTLGGGCNTL